MPQYRRFRLQGGTYFFTVNLAHRGSNLLVERVDTLRWAYARTHAELPILCDAMVVLPDHLHAIWTLPTDDADYAERWRRIKARFSHALDIRGPRSPSKIRKREKGIWQRRYWEHTVRGMADFDACMAYCRDNPVKHGLCEDWRDWPFSSFNRRRVGDPPTSSAA